MERAWALGYMKGSNDVAFGYDEGTISIKVIFSSLKASWVEKNLQFLWIIRAKLYGLNIPRFKPPMSRLVLKINLMMGSE
jgi:hypothetical protein